MKSEGLNRLWIAVKVERGFAAEVRAFSVEEPAMLQERIWRLNMNPDYDDTETFEVPIEHTIVGG